MGSVIPQVVQKDGMAQRINSHANVNHHEGGTYGKLVATGCLGQCSELCKLRKLFGGFCLSHCMLVLREIRYAFCLCPLAVLLSVG